MSGGKIAGINPVVSFLVQFVIKPGALAFAVLAYPWINAAVPQYQEATKDIVRATSETSKAMWPDDSRPHFGPWIFASILAAFLEFDNAYLCFFLKFNQIYSKKRGLIK